MIGRIIVPLDGSRFAEMAIPPAEALCKVTDARLALVRVTMGEEGPYVCRQVELEEARAYLAAVANEMVKDRDIIADTHTLCGPPGERIVEEAASRDADLVVMATHGTTGPGASAYGSVAEWVLTHSLVPVLLVRAWRPEQDRALNLRHPRILVPLDGSPLAEEALPLATQVADALGGELVLLRVAETGDPERGEGSGAELERPMIEAEGSLSRLAVRLALEGRLVRHEARVGEPARQIMAAGRDHGASLVVMTTHTREGQEAQSMGSVPGAVLAAGGLPLLLVRPRALESPNGRVGVSVEATPRGPVTLRLEPEDVAALRAAVGTLAEALPAMDTRLGARGRRLLERLAALGAER